MLTPHVQCHAFHLVLHMFSDLTILDVIIIIGSLFILWEWYIRRKLSLVIWQQTQIDEHLVWRIGQDCH